MRNIIKLALAGLLSVSTFAVAAESSPEALRIGYQKGSIGMVLAKSHQLLEKRYPESKISWVEFPAGPQMLEALNVGSIDLGSTGDIPPIFAQAAGADLVYVGVEPPKPKAEVILVAENSPIKTVADLKGHKVAFQKGSSSHNLLLRALRQAGLKFCAFGLSASGRSVSGWRVAVPASGCRHPGNSPAAAAESARRSGGE